MLRVLVLTSTPRQPDNKALWESLRNYAEVDLVEVPKERQANLTSYLSAETVATYDRVVIDLLFRYVSRQARLLRRIPNLLIYEEDACQEFITASKWKGKFSVFYQKVPNARIIMTGQRTAQAFVSRGVDACFLPKGFDPLKIFPTDASRDIPLGFIGRTASSAYSHRKEFLTRAEQECGLRLLRTEPGDDYRDTLNRIVCFLSADIELNEYMAKNFEAMACGCLLLAYRQGNGEEEALGLVDGENVILYGSFEECKEKLAQLQTAPDLMQRIALAGRMHALAHFSYAALASSLFTNFLELHQSRPVPSRMDRLQSLLMRRFVRRSGEEPPPDIVAKGPGVSS